MFRGVVWWGLARKRGVDGLPAFLGAVAGNRMGKDQEITAQGAVNRFARDALRRHSARHDCRAVSLGGGWNLGDAVNMALIIDIGRDNAGAEDAEADRVGQFAAQHVAEAENGMFRGGVEANASMLKAETVFGPGDAYPATRAGFLPAIGERLSRSTTRPWC